jgi:hypothetical protein
MLATGRGRPQAEGGLAVPDKGSPSGCSKNR